MNAMPSMLNRFQRSGVAIVRSVGFQPIGPAWTHRLHTLQGEFRRSTSERVFWYVVEGLTVCWGLWIVGFCVRDYLSWGLTQWPTAAMGCVVLSLGLFAITRTLAHLYSNCRPQRFQGAERHAAAHQWQRPPGFVVFLYG